VRLRRRKQDAATIPPRATSSGGCHCIGSAMSGAGRDSTSRHIPRTANTWRRPPSRSARRFSTLRKTDRSSGTATRRLQRQPLSRGSSVGGPGRRERACPEFPAQFLNALAMPQLPLAILLKSSAIAVSS